MNINVGSTNPIKVQAVKEILAEYSHLQAAVVTGFSVDTSVSDQPMSLEETITGACTRAKATFHDCSYSIGLESGLMHVPGSKSGMMDVCVCSIYDGKEFHLGLSSAWEAPKQIMDHIVHEGMNMTDAANKAGYSSNPTLGMAEGLVGIVTKCRLTRKAYTKEALRTALIHIDEPES